MFHQKQMTFLNNHLATLMMSIHSLLSPHLYNTLIVQQLRTLLKHKGVKGISKKTKQELVELLMLTATANFNKISVMYILPEGKTRKLKINSKL